MMTYKEAQETLAKARNPENGTTLGNNTRLYKRGKSFAIRLHNTDVVTIHADGTYTLSSGGWQTRTTKDRINLYTLAMVRSIKGIWYVKDTEFKDGMRIDQIGYPIV